VAGENCECPGAACGRRFAIVDGVVTLIDEQSSIFSLREAVDRRPARPATFRKTLLRPFRQLVPALGINRVAGPNLRLFRRLLLKRNPRPAVLVIGGARVGAGMAALLADSCIDWVESDVRLGERTNLLCDAHRVPFAENTFDGVVIQAVLEHVADPERCVSEIHRVLKPGGLVYAETAFMQQVHAGRHDFCRFTLVGHRRLFRAFEQITAGSAGGPAVALAWAWQHFLLSFTGSRRGRAAATAIACWTAFWLKYLDPFLSARPAALDAASAYFFLGTRREIPVTDREVVRVYPGAQRDAV
jgi:SAM-dependent methyltransferase